MVRGESTEATAFTRRNRKVTLHLLTAMDVTGDGQYSMQSSPIAIGEVRLGRRNNYACLDDAGECGPSPCTIGVLGPDGRATDVEAAQSITNTAVPLDSSLFPLSSSLISLLYTIFPLLYSLYFLHFTLLPHLYIPSPFFALRSALFALLSEL